MKTKKITKEGINGTFTGTVDVKFNYRKEEKMVHNPSTHDEEKRTFIYHIVTGKVNGKVYESSEFQNTQQVFKYIDEIEQQVNEHLYLLANDLPKKSLEEKLKDKGYF